MEQKNVKSYCRGCIKSTNHDVLSEYSELYRDEYDYNLIYQIVQCKGCDTKSFRYVFVDIGSAFYTIDGQWEVPEEVTVYPKAIEGHKEEKDIYKLPGIVLKIYQEVLLALREEAKILASLGLRGTVEAVCNDLNIPGNKLEARINKLASSGYISTKDAQRLHGIRFMGNDAAHDIKTPKDESLRVAFQIVEHLLLSVYILEKRANGNLETTIINFDIFLEILYDKLKQYKSGDELPIAQFLEKDIRRVKESITKFEQDLIQNINDGKVDRLSIGKLDHYKGSKEKLQHFIIK